jgi:hypothetical protein
MEKDGVIPMCPNSAMRGALISPKFAPSLTVMLDVQARSAVSHATSPLLDTAPFEHHSS